MIILSKLYNINRKDLHVALRCGVLSDKFESNCLLISIFPLISGKHVNLITAVFLLGNSLFCIRDRSTKNSDAKVQRYPQIFLFLSDLIE